MASKRLTHNLCAVLSAIGKPWRFRFRRAFGILLLSLLVSFFFAVPSNALDDALKTPSKRTESAIRSFFLDASRAGDRVVVVGERGHILFSDDNGKAWTQAEVPVITTLTAVYFVTPEKGWAVGHDAVILHTTDGGSMWKKQFDGFAATQVVLSKTRKRIRNAEARLTNVPESERASVEAELELAQIKLGEAENDESTGPSKPLFDVWFKDDKEGFAVGAYDYFFHTTDGGASWQDCSDRIYNPDVLHLNGIGAAKSGALFIAGESGTIFRSMDSGTTWERINSPYIGSFFGLLCPAGKDLIYVYGLRGHIFCSDDLGQSWNKVATGTGANIFGGAQISENKLVFVGLGGLMLICDATSRSCSINSRKDRRPLLAVVPVDTHGLLQVGQGGVHLVSLETNIQKR